MKNIIIQIQALKEVAAAGQDYYFKKYQESGDKSDFKSYKEYQGEETAYQRVLDILSIKEN